MTRALVATGFAVVLTLSGCSKPTSPGPRKSGPAVAQGEGVVVTVAEFQARLDEVREALFTGRKRRVDPPSKQEDRTQRPRGTDTRSTRRG